MIAAYIAALLAVLAVVVIVGLAVDRRRRRRASYVASGADTLLAGTEFHAHTPSALLATVLLATVFSAIAAAILVGNQIDQPARDHADQATNNYQRCSNRVTSEFRKAVDVFLIGYSVTDPAELAQVATELGLPANAGIIKAEGRARVVASYLDDLGLDASTRQLCPFVAGHPEDTPDRPVGSATADLDRRLAIINRKYPPAKPGAHP